MRRLLLGLALLAACAHFNPRSGYVRGHDYKPAHSYQVSDPIFTTLCSGSGSTFSCQLVITGWTFHTERVPDRWYLRIEDDAVDRKGNHQTGWIPVDQRTFDSYADDTHWPDPR